MKTRVNPAVADIEPSVIAKTTQGIRDLIRQRRIAQNGILPNYHQLCTEFGVSYMTVQRGMTQLEKAGLVRRVRGKGTFVTKDLLGESRPLQHLGIIYPDGRGSLLEFPHLIEILRGISAALPLGVDMHIFSLSDDGLVGASQLERWSVDGVLFLDIGNEAYLRQFSAWGIPGVVVDCRPRDVALDQVSGDNIGAAARVAEHLVADGHRHVAVAIGTSLHQVSDPLHPERPLLAWHSSELFERREAGLAALAACGIPMSEIACAGTAADWATTVVERLRPMLDRSDRPTALLTDSDLSAHLLHTALSQAGIRVPEDLSLCAVAGSSGYAQRESLHITCCHMDFLGMGRVAAERLAARCAAPAAEGPVRQRVGFTFAAGTTRPPTASGAVHP